MVKYKITKEEYDKLAPELQGEYNVSGEEYKLDVTGVDVKAQDKYDGERSKRRDAEKLAKEAQDKLDAFVDGDDSPDKLKARYEKDLAKANKAKDDALNTLTTVQRKNTLDKDARALADDLSKPNATVLMPHIMSRLDVDLSDPLNPKTVVLVDGKPSDKKLTDLKAEFLANKDFSGIITASRASGGVASKSVDTGRSGLPSAPGPNTDKPLYRLSPREMVAHVRATRLAAGQEVAEAK